MISVQSVPSCWFLYSTDYTWWHWFGTREACAPPDGHAPTRSISIGCDDGRFIFLKEYEAKGEVKQAWYLFNLCHRVDFFCQQIARMTQMWYHIEFIIFHDDCCTFYFSSYILYSCFILSSREQTRIRSRPYTRLLVSICAYVGGQTHAFTDTNLRNHPYFSKLSPIVFIRHMRYWHRGFEVVYLQRN